MKLKYILTLVFAVAFMSSYAQDSGLMKRDAHFVVDLEYKIKDLSKKAASDPEVRKQVDELENRLKKLSTETDTKYKDNTEAWTRTLTETREEYKKDHGY